MQEESLPVAGATLWTATQGSGTPLVLCHGGPGLSDNLGPLASMVDDLATVHRYDQRGAGRSTGDGPFDVATSVADIDALRAHWGHERWIVGGHSWGANLALLYALAHPDRVLGVLYVSGTGVRWGWQAATRAHRLSRLDVAEREELAALEALPQPLGAAAQARFLRLMWSTDFAHPRRAAVLDTAPLYAFPRNDRVFRELSASHRDVLEAGIEDRVRNLAAPLLALHGSADAAPERARLVAQLAPRGRFVEVDDAGHSPWLEHPRTTAVALREFIGAVGEAPRGRRVR